MNTTYKICHVYSLSIKRVCAGGSVHDHLYVPSYIELDVHVRISVIDGTSKDQLRYKSVVLLAKALF